jgi:hypothetical protein
VKQRLSLSVDKSTATYLADRARGETNGNVSALIDRIVREAWLAEAVRDEVAWYRAHPGFVEDAEAERYAADAA